MELRIAVHKETGIQVREDGAVLVPDNHSVPRFKLHWTYGNTDFFGYKRVKVGGKSYKVHRLVAEAFIENPEGKKTVDHIDRNRANNSLANLRWATSSEQRENSSSVINRADYGVREKDDKAAYQRAYVAANREKVNAWHREYKRRRREAQNGK